VLAQVVIKSGPKCAPKTRLSNMKYKAVFSRVHMCVCVPETPYRSSPGVVTGAVLYHISTWCLFVQQHLRASPPLTAARLSPETDAYPAQTGKWKIFFF